MTRIVCEDAARAAELEVYAKDLLIEAGKLRERAIVEIRAGTGTLNDRLADVCLLTFDKHYQEKMAAVEAFEKLMAENQGKLMFLGKTVDQTVGHTFLTGPVTRPREVFHCATLRSDPVFTLDERKGLGYVETGVAVRVIWPIQRLILWRENGKPALERFPNGRVDDAFSIEPFAICLRDFIDGKFTAHFHDPAEPLPPRYHLEARQLVELLEAVAQ